MISDSILIELWPKMWWLGTFFAEFIYTTHNKLRILGLIVVQFIYLIFLVTEICVTAKMSDYDQNKTLDMKIQHLLDVRNYTRSRTPQN